MNLSKEKTKRLIAIHGWSSVFLGLLLYVVIITGTVAVMASEIGRWSIGGKVYGDAYAVGLEDHVKSLSEMVDEKYLDNVSIYQNSEGRLVTFFHTHGTNDSGEFDDIGEMLELDPKTGEILLRREGSGSELFGTDPAGALDSFLVELHISLHLPDPWGLYATGTVGFLLLIAAITGFLTHKHLLRDIFVPARYTSALLHKRDRHILAGSWSLPFSFVLALTGAFLSFGPSLTLPMVGKTAFNGDQIAMYQAMSGDTVDIDETPSSVANLDFVVGDYVKKTGVNPTVLDVRRWGRADSRIIIRSQAAPNRLWRDPSVYDGASGKFLFDKPRLGAKPSAANAAYLSMNYLHFGTFGGFLSKVVWFSLGISMAYVTISGMRLWTQRRLPSPLWAQLDVATTVICYGIPISLAGSAYGFFLSLDSGSSRFWTPVAFLVSLASVSVVGILWRNRKRLNEQFLFALGLTLMLLPIARVLVVGGGWDIGDFDEIVVILDLSLAIGGLICIKKAGFGRGRSDEAKPDAIDDK